MDAYRLSGPNAGVIKYDVLTMLSVLGLNGSQTFQTSVLRLIALITARYNWRRDELVMGQSDMARLWSVNDRTAKREVKRLLEADLLVCKRAGVRGRVASYRLNMDRIAQLSETQWTCVGADFQSRMADRCKKENSKIVALKDYQPQTEPSELSPQPDTPWGRVQGHLSEHDPDLHRAWFARLEFVQYDAGSLYLKAPSRFVQTYIESHLQRHLMAAAVPEFGEIRQIVLAF
jgi:hypothetical protein